LLHLEAAGTCKRKKGKSVSKLKTLLEKLEYVTMLQKRQVFQTARLAGKPDLAGKALCLIGRARNEWQILRLKK
jgi:hypothetical protein